MAETLRAGVKPPRLALAAIALVLSLGSPAAAHTGERGQVLLLPTRLYIAAGAMAVALSFISLIVRGPGAAYSPRKTRLNPPAVPHWLLLVSSTASFVVLVCLVAAGFFGKPDPLSNPLPLILWTPWWIGFTALSAVAGNLWKAFNPWIGPYRLLAPRTRPLLGYPEALGCLPALLLFFAFAWFELVYPTPEDPSRLAFAVLFYALITFAGLFAFGPGWLHRGEAFTVFFGMVARLSPLQWNARQCGRSVRLTVDIGSPVRWLTEGPPLSPTEVAFVLLALSTVSFDGLSRTFTWIGWLDMNPLEFPGRSALVLPNTLGLLLNCLVLAAAFLGVFLIGRRAGAAPWTPMRGLGLHVLSLVPIAIGFHLAHYLPKLFFDWRHALRAVSDPFGRGWDLLGVSAIRPSSSMALDHAAVTAIYNLQTALVVLAHMMAVFASHRLVAAEALSRRAALLRQLPMTVFMIAYTVYGLWLLSTPVIG